MRWTASDILIELDNDGTDDPVVTTSISTPAGVLQVMAEPRIVLVASGRRLELNGLHMHGVTPKSIGVKRLRWLANAVMEAMDFDEILIRGATRTSGANPGHRPSNLRFKRARRLEA